MRSQRNDWGNAGRKGVHLPKLQQARQEKSCRVILVVCVAKRGILDVYTTVRHQKSSPSEWRAQVKKTKACLKCLDLHGKDSPCNKNFLCHNDECKRGDAPPDHHFFLCLKSPARRDTARVETRGERGENSVARPKNKRLCLLA